MAFEKLKQQVASHEGTIEEQEDLKQEENTSSEADQSEENDDTESKENQEESSQEDSEKKSVEELKNRLAKIEQERDNYRAGLLSLKAKQRSIEPQKEIKAEVKDDEEILEENKSQDITKQKIYEAIYEINEQKVLQDIINPSSSNYIAELEDDVQYSEIINYLPRNIDKSTPERIIHALQIAVNSWKYDKGIPIDKKENKQKDEMINKKSELASIGNTVSGDNKSMTSIKRERKFLKKSVPVTEWYN